MLERKLADSSSLTYNQPARDATKRKARATYMETSGHSFIVQILVHRRKTLWHKISMAYYSL